MKVDGEWTRKNYIYSAVLTIEYRHSLILTLLTLITIYYCFFLRIESLPSETLIHKSIQTKIQACSVWHTTYTIIHSLWTIEIWILIRHFAKSKQTSIGHGKLEFEETTQTILNFFLKSIITANNKSVDREKYNDFW